MSYEVDADLNIIYDYPRSSNFKGNPEHIYSTPNSDEEVAGLYETQAFYQLRTW